jgi:hypothetical protein
MIDQLVQQVIGLESRLKFITLVYEGKIEIYKKKKEEILKQMQMYQVQEELLSQIRLSSLTEEEIGDLGYDIEELQKKKLNLESVTPEDMWIKDLQEFEKFYISVYGDELKKDASTRYRNEKIDYDDELPNL